MPLPEKVIEQLGREPPKTPGWSFGIISFAGGIFFIVLINYLGLVFGYEPYLNKQVTGQQDQINQLNQSISADDQTKLINFYSQLSNLKSVLRDHTLTTQFFSWLEKNTEANVYYGSFSLTAGSQVAIVGNATTEADVNQQIAIFEASPEVQKVSVSNVSAAPSGNGWTFNATLTMKPSIFTTQR
jgi:superoxide dismutase